ncbi:g8782 [Coccomyxa viridis]|uniref:G8782 protein n=1 Tax=Coccomyxa viridis TaxID=1274662 RepID=A0ABP1G184_9CHLO
MEGPTSHGQTSGQEEGGRETSVVGLTDGHARPQSTTSAECETRPNRSTESTHVCQIPCCPISPIVSDCVVCEHPDAPTKRPDPSPGRQVGCPDSYPRITTTPSFMSPERRTMARRVTNRQSAEQMQRFNHGASGNYLLGRAEKLQLRQCSESNEPCLIADKAAPSCSRDLWKDPIIDFLKKTDVAEGTSVLKSDELEVLPVSTTGNTDVWIMDKTLVEAIDAGMSKSGGLKLSVRGPGSTGYRIEAVSVEQLQDIQHPLECSGGAQHEDAGRNPDSPLYKKQRHVWTSEAHHEFSNIVKALGDRAAPMRILQLMHVNGLTREQVASHLQKYRAHAKEQIQKVNYEDVLAQASRVLGEAGMEVMLRKLENVGLQAMLAAREMANGTSTAPDEQAHMRIALAKPDAGSTSSQPTLASECPSRQTPRCEDRQYLPGQGSRMDSVNTYSDQSAISTQPGLCTQPDLAEIAAIMDQEPSRDEWSDSMGHQGLDDFLKSFTQP